jgi:hypothetical protein
MIIHGESSYKYAARRSHVPGITPHRTVKTLRLGIRHQRIGDRSRSESRVCTCPPESGRSRFLCEFSSRLGRYGLRAGGRSSFSAATAIRYSSAPYLSHPDSRTSPDVRSCSGVCSFPITSRYLVWGLPSATGSASVFGATSINCGSAYVLHHSHCSISGRKWDTLTLVAHGFHTSACYRRALSCAGNAQSSRHNRVPKARMRVVA